MAELRSPKPAVGGSSPSCPAPNQHQHRTGPSRKADRGEPTDQAHDGEAGRRQAARARAQGRSPSSRPRKERTGPRQFFSEVRGELRKVAWPTAQEVINSTIVVLIAVVVMTTLIFGFDYVSAKAVLFLYD